VSRTGGRERPAIVAVKACHTSVFFVVAGSILYLLYSALRRRTDVRAAAAGAVVAGEALIFATSGWRCPLTGVAERLGADNGSVTDIYLPGWVASHLPQVTIPLVTAAVVLHARNLWDQSSRRACDAGAPRGETSDAGRLGGRVRNVHRRAVDDVDAVGTLLDGLGSAHDRLWPRDRWPAMRLDRPLQVGARGGHGPISYRVELYEPKRRVRFRFERPAGFDGFHEFCLVEGDPSVLEHLLEAHMTGAARFSWPLVFRPEFETSGAFVQVSGGSRNAFAPTATTCSGRRAAVSW
jgi:hypothetical protein